MFLTLRNRLNQLKLNNILIFMGICLDSFLARLLSYE